MLLPVWLEIIVWHSRLKDRLFAEYAAQPLTQIEGWGQRDNRGSPWCDGAANRAMVSRTQLGGANGMTGTALYNPDLRPFASPVPFLLLRQAVVSDWRFFLDDLDWLERWARRYGKSGARALAEELRRCRRAHPPRPASRKREPAR
jgi:hypothetical protein